MKKGLWQNGGVWSVIKYVERRYLSELRQKLQKLHCNFDKMYFRRRKEKSSAGASKTKVLVGSKKLSSLNSCTNKSLRKQN